MPNKLSDYLQPEGTGLAVPAVDPTFAPDRTRDIVSSRNMEEYDTYFPERQIPLSSPFLDDMRANLQSRADKWANGVVRAVATAGTTFTETFADVVVGVPLALATGDMTKVYDNDITRALDEINEKLRAAMPIYGTEAYQEMGLFQKMGKANFWADDFLQGVGFMGGAVLATMATGGLMSGAGVGKAAQGVYGALAKGMRTGKGAGTAAELIKGAHSTLKGLEAAKRGSKEVMSTMSSLIAAVGESGIEARGARDTVRENLEAAVARGDMELTPEEIDAISAEAGNVAFGINMALVGGSNVVQFGRLARGMVGAQEAVKTGTRMVGKGALARAAADNASKFVDYGWATLKNPLTEAAQEGGQFITEKAMESIYSTYYDPEAGAEVADYIDGMYRGLKETFGSTEGQTSMFLGALLGGIGIPGVGGGIVGDIQEVSKQRAANSAAAEAINSTHLGKKFAALSRSATFNSHMSKIYPSSTMSGDPFTVINEEMDQAKGYLLEMARAGRLDIVEQHLQGLEEASADVSTQAPDGTISEWEQLTGQKVKPENIKNFVDFMRDGMEQARKIVERTESYESVHPDFALLLQELMFNDYKAEELAKQAEKTIADIFSNYGYSFNRSQVFERNEDGTLNGSPAANINALIKKLKNTYALPTDQVDVLMSAQGILLGAEGQKELAKQAFDYINSQREDNFAEIAKQLRAKRKLFDQRTMDAKSTKTLVDMMDMADPELRELYQQNVKVVDGEFFSSEFEIVVPPWDNSIQEFGQYDETPTEERARHMREREEDIAAGKPEEEIRHAYLTRPKEEKQPTKMLARFNANGDIIAFNEKSGREITFKRGPRNYQMIDRNTIRPVDEVVAATHSIRLSAQIKAMGNIVNRNIADANNKVKDIKRQIRTLKKSLKEIKDLEASDLVPEELRAKIGTELKTQAEVAQYLSEEIKLHQANLNELQDIIREFELERDVLREEYKMLRANPMTAKEYEERGEQINADMQAMEAQAEEYAGTIRLMRNLLNDLNAFLRKAAKITDPDLAATEAEAFKAFLENNYELLLPIDVNYFSTLELKNKIAEVEGKLAELERKRDILEKTPALVNTIMQKYKRARAAEKRRLNNERNKRQKFLDDLKRFSKENPTTEIPNQHRIFDGELESPKGTIEEVFASTTGNWKDASPHQQAWFKFTSEATPEELEGMRLVPVIAGNNKFADYFAANGISFYDETDIKLVLVDEAGEPVMRYGQPLYSSLPLARATWMNEAEKRFQAVSQAEEDAALDAHARRREKIVAAIKAGEDLAFKVLYKRRGIPQLDTAYIGKLAPSQREAFMVDPHKSVVGTLVPDDAAIDNLVVDVATSPAPGERGLQTVSTGEQAVLRAGAVFAVANGTLVPLIKRRFSRKEAATLVNLIRFHAAEYQKLQQMRQDPKASKQEIEKFARTYGTIPGTNMKAKEYLMSVLAFDNYNQEESFNIYFTKNNTLVFGSQEIDISDLIENDQYMVEALETFLTRKFHHVNKARLKNKKEFASVEMTEDFKTKVTKYKSYKHYLLAPEGRQQNEVPLGTWLVDASDDIGSVQYKSVNLVMDYGEGLSMEPDKPVKKASNLVLSVAEGSADATVAANAADKIAAAKAAKQAQQEPKIPAGGFKTRAEAEDYVKKNMVGMLAGVDITQLDDVTVLAMANMDFGDSPVKPVDDVKTHVVVEQPSFGEESTGLPAEGTVVTKEEMAAILAAYPSAVFILNEDGTHTFITNIALSRTQTSDIEPVSAETLQEEFDWFNKSFSSEERVVIGKIAKEGALGVTTEAGEVLISPFTAPGTVYHEAFHLVSNFYLTAQQQQELWNEWRERTGNKNASDLEAEEGLAEDFRVYAQSGGTILPKYKNKNLLQRLWQFLKNLVTGKRNIESVFSNIYSGGFASKTRARTTMSRALLRLSRERVNLEEFRKAAGVRGSEINEMLDNMMSLFMESTYSLMEKMKGKVDIKRLIEGAETLNMGGTEYNSSEILLLMTKGAYVRMINNALEDIDSLSLSELNTIELTKTLMVDNWDSMKNLFLEYFEQTGYYIASREGDRVIDVESGDTVEDYRDAGVVESKEPDWVTSVEIDPTRTLAKEVKLLLGGIRKFHLGTRELQLNPFGLPKTASVRELTLYLQNHLADTRTFPDMIRKMRKLAEVRPELNVIMDRMRVPLHGDVFTTPNLAPHYKSLQDAFFKQFSRARYDFLMLMKNRKGELNFFNSAADRNESRVVQTWKNALNFMIARNPDMVKITKGTRVFNENFEVVLGNNKKKTFKELATSEGQKGLTLADKLKALEQIGIQFDAKSLVDLKVINENFGFVMSEVASGSTPISSLFSNRSTKSAKQAGVYNRIQKVLAAEAVRVSDGIIDIMFQTPEGKTIFGISDYNYLHNTVEQLRLGNLPEHLNPDTNPLLSHSAWLKDSDIRSKLRVKLISGFKSEQGDKAMDTSKADEGTLMTIMFQSVLNRIIPVPRTSDKKLSYGIEVPEEAWFGASEEGKLVDYLMDVLKMELKTWQMAEEDALGSEIQYMNQNLRGLRLFKTIVPEGLVPQSNEDIVEYLEENRGRIENWVREQVRLNGKKAEELMLKRMEGDNVVTVLVPSTAPGRNVLQPKTMSKGKWSDYLHEFTYNYIAGTIETHSMLFGDFAAQKNFEDYFKRTSGAIGTKVMPRVDSDNLLWMDANYARTDGRVRDGSFRSYTFEEPKVSSAIAQELQALFPDNYGKMAEADAQGWISMDGYRDFHLFNNSWTPQMETAFQKTIKGEKLNKNEMGLFGPIKPMYYGPQKGTSVPVNAYLKTSLMPLVPELLKNGPNQRLLSKLSQEMFDKQVDVVVVSSGNKLGRKYPQTEEGANIVQPLYSENGTLNDLLESGVMSLDWQYFGEQVRVDTEIEERVNFGTQVRKLIWANMFSNGKPKAITGPGGTKITAEQVMAQYERYNSQINAFLYLDEFNLLSEFGLKKVGDLYEFSSYGKAMELIEKEMLRQQYPANSIAGMKMMFSDPNLPKKVDLLPNKREIETLLMSLAKNRVMRQKMSGAMRVLVASTGFEVERKDITISNDLKFYQSVSGDQTTRAEIKIPLPTAWIKPIYSLTGMAPGAPLSEVLAEFNKLIQAPTPEFSQKFDMSLLNKIGYRIPNHGLPATDSLRVKEFLHPTVQNMVILPTEIVEKAGSDYDIDKLTVFDRNYVWNAETGELKAPTEGRAAEENGLLDIMDLIMLAPENYKALLQPTDTKPLKDLADKIRNRKQIRKTQNSGLDTLSFLNMIRVSRSLWAGKDGVGITATHTTSHSLSQASGLGMNEVRMPFEGFEEQNTSGILDLSREMTIDGKENVINNLGMFLNAFVDVSKDDFVIDINATPDTANMYFFLLRAGVPVQTAVYFMNQPVLTYYFNQLQTMRSAALDGERAPNAEGKMKPITKSKAQIIKEISAMVASPVTVEVLTESKLWKGIESQDMSSPDGKALQNAVFNYFLALEQPAETLSTLVQNTDFDTNFAKSMREPAMREGRIASLELKDIFVNLGKYLDNTTISGFRKYAQKSSEYYRSLFLSADPRVTASLAPLLNILDMNSNSYSVKKNDMSRAYKALEDDFTTYILNTVKVNGSAVSDRMSQMMTGPNSIPVRLQQASRRPELRENYFIKKVIPEISEFSEGLRMQPDSLRPFSNKFNNAETTALIDGIRELHELNPQLANDLIDFFVLQSGVGFSPRSLVRAIPFDLFIPRAAQIIENFSNQDIATQMAAFPLQFLKNNVHLNGVVPKIRYQDSTASKQVSVKVFAGIDPLPYVSNVFMHEVTLEDGSKSFIPHTGLYEFSHIKDDQAIYKRIGEQGDSQRAREYYPYIPEQSMFPKNNLDAQAISSGTVAELDSAGTPKAKTPTSAPLEKIPANVNAILKEVIKGLTSKENRWFIENDGFRRIMDYLQKASDPTTGAVSEASIKEIVSSLIKMTKLNCK